jgi:putative tricarboxylic transport membrane protein
MHKNEPSGDDPGVVTNKTMEIVVALLLIGASAIVIFDSKRIGLGWQEGQGPAPGYFPFWVAVALALSSLYNLFNAVRGADADGGDDFVSKTALGRVLAVLVPTAIYVAVIGGVGPIPGLGIYVASAIFIALFMLVFGKEKPIRTVLVSIGVPLLLFFMFERWFLVPLPKGPLEAMLGFA